MRSSFPIDLLVNNPHGLAPLTPERADIELPKGPDGAGTALTYGAYLAALSSFLCRDSHAALIESLSLHLGKPVDTVDIRGLKIISQKHGALYHVAEARVDLQGQPLSLALNVAVEPDQQAFLENELGLLQRLHARFGLPYLPRPYVSGETHCEGTDGRRMLLKVFAAEWFQGFHELHLSQDPDADHPALRVWDDEKGAHPLSAAQTEAFYTQAAAILTAYLDPEAFEQIYPWHHAAGDFVIRCHGEAVDLRLITARDHRSLVSPGPDPGDNWIGVVHFLLNLTLRMRLDRFDGTGELAWAPPECLKPIISGFSTSWTPKAQKNPSLPSPEDVLDLLRSFTPDELLPLAQIVLEDGMVEAEECDFLREHLDDHLVSLGAALNGELP